MYRTSLLPIFYDALSRHIGTAPSELQIKSAAVAVHVQHLACSVDAGQALDREGGGVNLGGGDAAGGDLCATEALGAGDGNLPIFNRLGNTDALLLGEGVNLTGEG